jgi:radical SAM-linked protein
MTTRPVRERSLDNLDSLLQRTLDNTGYEEVSLVSLSTCDYSRVRQLVENTVERARPQRVSVSLPSLRLDSFSVELADMVAEIRRTGLTVAPEAASPRLRAVINKWIPDEGLLEMSRGAFTRGWGHVKLYFMIGLPTERDDDVLAIADLAKRTVQQGQEITRRAKVNLGVSTFVPKPFTPFQWAEQISFEETRRKQDVLQKALGRDRSIKFGRHEPEETWLEGLVSRADRRAADLLQRAFELGCRFDAWREHLRFDLWLQAIEETGYDAANALRERHVDERLPWDHIDILVDKSWFQEDWARALELKHAEDCRHRKCHKCGVIDHVRPLCASMLRKSIQGRKPEESWERKPTAPFEEPPAVQRLWLRITRTGEARYLSHLEVMNAWRRSLRRVKAPLSYSQGFHPHPKMAFSAALPVGLESLGEYLDITLSDRVEPETFLAELQKTLPDGFGALAIAEVPLKTTALMAVNQGGEYTIRFPNMSRQDLQQRVADLMAREVVEVMRKRKNRKKVRGRRGPGGKVLRPIDIRPMLRDLTVRDAELATLDLTVVSVDGKPGKAKEVVALLTDQPETARILKRDTLCVSGDGWVSISDNWAVEPAIGAMTAAQVNVAP